MRDFIMRIRGEMELDIFEILLILLVYLYS